MSCIPAHPNAFVEKENVRQKRTLIIVYGQEEREREREN